MFPFLSRKDRKLTDFGFPEGREVSKPVEVASNPLQAKPQEAPQNVYLDLEKRLSVVEIKLYELRTLLLEQDYKKQNQLSKFGRRIKRFSV